MLGRLTVVLVLVALLVGAPAAAAPTCEGLAGAPVADAAEPAIGWARALAGAVAMAEARLDLRAPAAVMIVERAEAGAWWCAGDDRIYLSAALVRWAWLGRAVDGGDFLGFVVAHELAHRRFDPADGALAEAACPEVDSAREAAADARAAFLLATSRDPTRDGRRFSPFNLARHDALVGFFVAELGWARDCPALTRRVQAVDAALARMAHVGRLYDAALVIALAGGPDALVDATLEALAGALAGPSWEAVPELALVRAAVHLERAGRVGWCDAGLARAPLSPSPCALPCAPTLPRWPALAPWDRHGGRAAAGVDRALELARVRRLLARAAELGIEPAALRTFEACVAYAEGAPERGLALASREQRPLLHLQRALLEAPDPVGGDAWREHLAGAGPWDTRSEVGAVVAAWLGLGPPAPEAPRRSAPTPASLDAWVTLAGCAPKDARDLGDGWHFASAPGCVVISRRGAPQVSLVEATPSGLASTIEAWRGPCEVEARGRADDGARVLSARCPRWDGPGEGWLLFEGATPRIVRVRSGP